MIASGKIEEQRGLGNVTSSVYRREKSKSRLEKPNVRNMGNGNVRGPRVSYGGCLPSRDAQSEGRSREKMEASKSQGCGKQCGQ
jgi:hypothetical protein